MAHLEYCREHMIGTFVDRQRYRRLRKGLLTFILGFPAVALTAISTPAVASETDNYCTHLRKRIEAEGDVKWLVEEFRRHCGSGGQHSIRSAPAHARPAPPSSGNANVDAINSLFSLIESTKQLVKDEQEAAREQREIERRDEQRAAQQRELNEIKRKLEAERRASQPTPLPPAKSADDDFLDGGRLRKEYKAFINTTAPTSTTAAQTNTIPSRTETRSNFSARSYGADSVDDPILVSTRDKSLERAMPRVLMRLAANTFELGRRMNSIGASLNAFKTALKTIDPIGEFDSAVAKANPFKLEDDD